MLRLGGCHRENGRPFCKYSLCMVQIHQSSHCKLNPGGKAKPKSNKGQIVSFYYTEIKIEQQGLQWPLTCSGCGTLNLTVPPAVAVVPDVTHAVQRSSERPRVRGDPGHASPFSCRKAKRRIGCCGSWCVPLHVGLLHRP